MKSIKVTPLLILIGIASVFLASCSDEPTLESAPPFNEKTLVDEVPADTEADAFLSLSIQEDEKNLEQRLKASAFAKEGDYRKMSRVCRSSGSPCINNSLRIETTHAYENAGQQLSQDEYHIGVLGFESKRITPQTIVANTYQDMTYRVIATSRGYLPDIFTWQHNSEKDEHDITLQFNPTLIRPVKGWDLDEKSFEFTHGDVQITGEVKKSPSGNTRLYLFDMKRGDIMETNNGIIYADSIVDGQLKGPIHEDRIIVVLVFDDEKAVNIDAQITANEQIYPWKFDIYKGIWIREAKADQS